jgi:hypothetical protein
MPKLSKQEEEIAKARAQKSGRPYPNPIDVTAVARRRVFNTGGERGPGGFRRA